MGRARGVVARGREVVNEGDEMIYYDGGEMNYTMIWEGPVRVLVPQFPQQSSESSMEAERRSGL